MLWLFFDVPQGEESRASVRRCLLKVALIAAQLEKYQKAIQIYEQVSKQELETNLETPYFHL